MKAIIVTDQAAGTAGMTLMERPEQIAEEVRHLVKADEKCINCQLCQH